MNKFIQWKELKAEVDKKTLELAVLAREAESEVSEALAELRGSATPEQDIPAFTEVVEDKPISTSPKAELSAPKKPTKDKFSTGSKFNNWTVIGPSAAKYKLACKCVCGVEKDVSIYSLGKTMGCGCETKNRKAESEKTTLASSSDAEPKKLTPRQKIEEFKEKRRLERELQD